MKTLKRKSKKKFQDYASSTKDSDNTSREIESCVADLNDSSISLYSAIQSIWNDYQSQKNSFPCLDILADLAFEEISEKIFKP